MFFITHKAVGFKSQVSVLLTANQSIPADTWTQLHLNSEVDDGLSEFNITTYRFTPKKDGLYNVAAQVTINNMAVDTWVAIQFRVNGDTYPAQSYKPNPINAISVDALVFKKIPLLHTDYLEVWCRHSNIAAKDADSNERATFLTIERVK